VPAADGPLAPWRVLVTRPQEQAAPFADALAAAGATPIVYPTIELGPPPSWQPLDDALARRAEYGWVIFTSPSAVAFTLARAAAIGLPAAALVGARIAAVGTQTARALTERGLSVELVPGDEDQRQEGLLEALLVAMAGAAPETVPRPRILFPQAVGGRELLRDQLVGRGFTVDVVPVSQTIARKLAAPPPEFDVATFASPSALRAFVDAPGATAALARAVVAVIGPTTARAAAEAGVRVDVMPRTPSVTGVVDALIHFRAAHFAPPRD